MLGSYSANHALGAGNHVEPLLFPNTKSPSSDVNQIIAGNWTQC